MLFTIYASTLFDILESHLPSVHTYVDDTLLCMSFNPSDNTSEAAAVVAIENSIRNVRAWMRNDKSRLNDNKTEFIIIGTDRQLSKVSVNKLEVGHSEVAPNSSVRNLSTWLASKLDMSAHAPKACGMRISSSAKGCNNTREIHTIFFHVCLISPISC